MNAMVYRRYGTPDVLRFREVHTPSPRDDEVRVRVYAASLNSWDWDLLRGKPMYARIGGLLRPQYAILGADIAGRIEAVGREVTRFEPGDEVFGDISGHGRTGLTTCHSWLDQESS